TAARTASDGAPILLLEQDRRRWDRRMIARGLTALARAETLARTPGPYQLQAAIAACHARAPTPDATDWIKIAALYEALVRRVPTPVVALNHAVAMGMAFGPERGLELVDAIVASGELSSYHLLPSVRGDLLSALGRFAEAS